MTTRPKTFKAIVRFSVRGEHFEPGDDVTGAALAAALSHGDRFVEPTKRRPKSETPPTTTPQPTPESEA